MSRVKISIQIVTWNSLKFLPDCLESIFQQTFKDFLVLIIDNASTDGTIEFVEKNYPKVRIIKNSKNLGFARAHNQGIITTQSDYILVMNPDVILEPDFLEKLIEVAEEDKRIGSLGGKLLKIKSGDQEIAERIKTNIIDSTGLKIFKSRRVIDRGEGEIDKGQYNQPEEVFGISGACVLYRRQALEDVLVPRIKADISVNPRNDQRKSMFTEGEYFDQDFFCYKEDIDLAWRLQLRGWKAIYLPEAKAYHFRSVSISERFNKSPLVNFFSYRNHLWMLLKNDYFSNFLRHLWFIFWYQLSKELYLLFTQPDVLFKGSLAFWQGFSKMYKKRKYIIKRAKIKAEEMRKWFN